MTEVKKNRAFISTATAFTFIPTMITSLFLLFHVKFPGIMDIHKWVGLAFILLCLLHIPINWTVLRKHFGTREAVPAMILTILLTFGMFVLGLSHGDTGRGHHGKGYASQSTISRLN